MTPTLAGRAVRFARGRLLIALLPALLVLALIAAAGVLAITLFAAQSGAADLQSETITAREANASGLDPHDLRAIKAVAADAQLPWQILVALAVAANGPISAAATAASPTATAEPAAGSSGWGRYRITPAAGLDQADAENLTTASAFIAAALQPNLIGHPGWSGPNSLVAQATVDADGLTVDRTSPLYLDRRSTTIAALVALPVADNSQAAMSRVYDTAQQWALGRSADCETGVGDDTFENPSGGGLSGAVPEPMRSALVLAGQDAGVSPAAVAGLYLTEQNGFQFMYRYYDQGQDAGAFQLTPTAAEWHLDRYGTSGEWPAGGSFRGPFQFGPIWESTYRTPTHPDVLNFADAAHGAAHYLADLGANGTDLESIRAAARSYNGQVSWTIGGGIRNPDPARYPVVQDLYADQVVHLTQSLADDTPAETATPTADPAGGQPAASSSPTLSTIDQPVSGDSGPPTACGDGTGVDPAAGPVSAGVIVNGTDVTIPDQPDVAPELRGKAVVAPNPQIAAGIAWGFTQLGTPYVWGGGGLGSADLGGPDHGCNRATCLPELGYDCSGLAWTVYYRMDPSITLSVGNSGAMAAGGFHIPLGQSVAGDLVTYGGSATHHVAVSLGYIDGSLAVLEAPQTGLNVRVIYSRSADINNWVSRYWQ